MKSKLFTLLPALIFLGAALAGCKPDANEEFIQGVWFYNDEHLQNLPAESHLTDQWLFDRGTFQRATCCFVTADYSGNYRLLESEQDHLQLELYNLRGDIGNASLSRQDLLVITLTIQADEDSLQIDRASPYHRLTP
jgi:hypothetical protein